MPARNCAPAFLTLAGLFLSGCTHAASHDVGVVSTGIDDVQASWTSINAAAALPRDASIDVASSAPGVGRLPALVVGSTGQPGEPETVAVWLAGNVGPDTGRALEVGGSESWASDVAAVGRTTFVLGERWHAGTLEPFLQASADRVSWRPVELPSALVDRGVRVSELVGEPNSGLAALGVDQDDNPVAALVDSAQLVPLPTPSSGRLDRFSGAASSGRILVAFGELQREDGGVETAVFRSADKGTTWESAGSLEGAQSSLMGAVAVKSGFLATGYSRRGSDYAATAWFSKDGRSWRPESLPRQKFHSAGWSTWLTAPTSSSDGTAFVIHADAERAYNQVLRRSPSGKWTIFGEMPVWRTPGAMASVVADGPELVSLRWWNGLLQTGAFSRAGDWRRVNQFGQEPRVAWWEAVSPFGESPMLVGGRQEVQISEDGHWSRRTELTPFTIEDRALAFSGWKPPAAEGVTSIATATDDEGNVLVVGQKIRSSREGTNTNGTDVVGWIREAGAHNWRSARGLSGPRTEFVTSAAFLDGRWFIAGKDRESFALSDHSYGALWTSSDGRIWTRAKGPFEVSQAKDSWLSSTCSLPSGDLLAVGGVEDNDTGSQGLAFRGLKNSWRRADLTGMGTDVTNLDSCAGTGDVTLVQGTAGGRAGVWATTDGEAYREVTIGGPRDEIGNIVPVAGGFAAPGSIGTGLQDRAVVWLSADGAEWNPVDVPADRALNATDVQSWGDAVLVALTGTTGPALVRLDNPAELLR